MTKQTKTISSYTKEHWYRYFDKKWKNWIIKNYIH